MDLEGWECPAWSEGHLIYDEDENRWWICEAYYDGMGRVVGYQWNEFWEPPWYEFWE
jgi:hypothetical protein